MIVFSQFKRPKSEFRFKHNKKRKKINKTKKKYNTFSFKKQESIVTQLDIKGIYMNPSHLLIKKIITTI